MRQNVAQEADKASQSFTQFTQGVTEGQSAIDRALDKLGYSIEESTEDMQQKLRERVRESKSLIEEMESLTRSLPKAAGKQTGYQKSETLSELEAVKKALWEEKGRLTELESKLKAASEASRRLVAQKSDLREEMTRLKIAGQENTDEYRRMAEEMTVLENATQEVGKQIRLLGKSDNVFRGIVGGFSGLSGALTAGAGAASLFGKKSESLEEVQTRLQALLSITVGLQGTYNTLQETAAFRTVVVAKAQQAWTAAQTVLNTQLGISVGLSKALMISGVGLLLAGTAALVALYKNWNREQKEINEARREGARSAQAEITQVKSLEAVLKNSNNTYNARRTALDELKKLMPSYNALLDKEGNLINDNTDALKKYIEQVKNAAMAKIYADRLAAAETAYNDWVSNLTRREEDVLFSVSIGEVKPEDDYAARVLDEKRRRLLGKIEAYEKQLGIYQAQALDGATPAEGTEAYWKRQQDAARSALAVMDDAQKGSQAWNRIVAEYNQATEKLKAWEMTGAKEEGQAKSARQKLAEEEVKGRVELDALLLEAMDEGAKKRLRQAENERDKELEMIRLKRAQIADLETKAQKDNRYTSQEKAHAAALAQDLDAQEKAVTVKYEAAVRRINEASQKALEGVWKDVYKDLASELERELLEIERSYDERAKIIKEETTDATDSETQLHRLALERERAITIARTQNLLKVGDAEKEIALERQALANKHVLLEADKEKKLLKIEIEAVKKRLKYLQVLQLLGFKGLEQEIRETEVRLNALTESLGELGGKKAAECIEGIEAIATALASVGGDTGDFFSALAAQISNLGKVISTSATPYERIAAGVGAIVSVITTLTSAAERNREAEKEFYRNGIALAHEYALALNELVRTQAKLSGGGFVTDYHREIQNSFLALTDATNNYNNALAELAKGQAKISLRDVVDWGSIADFAGAGAAIGAGIGSIIPGIGTAVGLVVGSVVGWITGGIAQIFGGGGKKEVQFAGLLEVFPELVTASGELNKELARAIINTDQVDENTKQLLQNALDWADAIDAANEQIKSVVTELAGDLGNSLREAIVGAWKAGEDASAAMFDAAGKSLEHFVENLLFSLLFSDIFTAFSDRLAASLNPVTGDGDVLDDYDYLMEAMDERDDFYISLLDMFKNRAKERGYNMWEDDTAARTGMSRGIESISQDSADKIEGGIYALRITANNIENLTREERDILSSMMSHIGRIVENTEYCRFLKDINERLTDIQLRGVIIR
jgi:hypothetical protein